MGETFGESAAKVVEERRESELSERALRSFLFHKQKRKKKKAEGGKEA